MKELKKVRNLKKNLLTRGFIGALAGVFIGQVVCIIVSLCMGGKELMPVPPELTEQVGSEIAAFILQNLACMLYGSVWAMASIVWEVEGWSLAKQTRIHWQLCSTSALPIAWLLHWFPHTWAGAAGYFASFAVIYGGIWLGQYLAMRRHVKAVNQKLNQQ